MVEEARKFTSINNCALSDFLCYRNVPHSATNRTIFGYIPRTHLSMVIPSMSEL